MWFSRIRLTPGAGRTSHYWEAANDIYSAHQLVWQFFADDPDRNRDFIYRFDATDHGPTYYVVSARKPLDAPKLPFKIESKEYEPRIETGDTLGFNLRANPTQRNNGGRGDDNRRHDIVMVEKRRRREANESIDQDEIVQTAGNAWLARQGQRHGFELAGERAFVTGHRPHRFKKASGRGDLTVTGMDFEGLLRVTDEKAFTAMLGEGVGSAKGFGFGMMMVRRA